MASLTQKFLATLGVAATIFGVTPAFAEPDEGRGKVFVSATNSVTDNEDLIFNISLPLSEGTQMACLAVADTIITEPDSVTGERITKEFNLLRDSLFMPDSETEAGAFKFKSAQAVCGDKTRSCGEGAEGTVVCSTYSTIQPEMK